MNAVKGVVNFLGFNNITPSKFVTFGIETVCIAKTIEIIWNRQDPAFKPDFSYKQTFDYQPTLKDFDINAITREMKMMKELLSDKLPFLKNIDKRYEGQDCPVHTAIRKKINGKYLHANKVGNLSKEPSRVKDKFTKYIATQLPLDSAGPLYWQTVIKKGAVLVDLNEKYEISANFFPMKSGEEKSFKFGKEADYTVTVKSIRIFKDINNCTIYEYEIKDNLTQEIHRIDRIHYTGWEDFNVVDPTTLHALVNLINTYKKNEKKRPIINCMAGLGRTGVMCAVLRANAEIETFNSENCVRNVAKLIFEHKTQRGPDCVYNPKQFQSVGNYVEFRLKQLGH